MSLGSYCWILTPEHLVKERKNAAARLEFGLLMPVAKLGQFASNRDLRGEHGRGPDLVWTTSQSGLSIEAADGGDWYMATNDFA